MSDEENNEINEEISSSSEIRIPLSVLFNNIRSVEDIRNIFSQNGIREANIIFDICRQLRDEQEENEEDYDDEYENDYKNNFNIKQICDIGECIKFGEMYDEIKKEHTFCCICREDFTDDLEILITSCFHIFCKNCISEWILTKDTCPMCRQSL